MSSKVIRSIGVSPPPTKRSGKDCLAGKARSAGRSSPAADDAEARQLLGKFQKAFRTHAVRQAGDVKPWHKPHRLLHPVPTKRAGCHAVAPRADAGRRPRWGGDPPAHDE